LIIIIHSFGFFRRTAAIGSFWRRGFHAVFRENQIVIGNDLCAMVFYTCVRAFKKALRNARTLDPPIPGRVRIPGQTKEARRAHGLFRFYFNIGV
jgi:hypothetical protein